MTTSDWNGAVRQPVPGGGHWPRGDTQYSLWPEKKNFFSLHLDILDILTGNTDPPYWQHSSFLCACEAQANQVGDKLSICP